MVKLSKKSKAHIKSAFITFLTGFTLVISTSFDSLTIESLEDGTAVGVFAAAVRFGLKMMFEAIAAKLAK